MLRAADARYALLEPGDVTIFDMRLLHCGTKNLVADAGGRTRYFLNFTFCNPRADQSDLGHVPCIRPGYERRMTLRDARAPLRAPLRGARGAIDPRCARRAIGYRPVSLTSPHFYRYVRAGRRRA